MNAPKPLPRSTSGESFLEYCERLNNRLGLDPLFADVVRAWNRMHGAKRLRLVVDNTQETRQ